MCKDCGCSMADHPVHHHHHAHEHDHHHDHHDHTHTHTHTHTHHQHHQHEHEHEHEHELSHTGHTRRRLQIEESIFEKNQSLAKENRAFFENNNLKVFNIMSSPGSGKTSLLARILPELNEKHRLAVLVGDQETEIDAERLKKAGLQSLQINTHSACHLDAHRIAHAVEELPLNNLDWIVIENVGNLVCPAVFDLGEQVKIALLSTPEGEEKPLKYPVLFHDADLIVITKCDLIPYLDYSKDLVMQNIRKMNPHAPLIFCSIKTGEGLDELKNTWESLSLKLKLETKSLHALSQEG